MKRIIEHPEGPTGGKRYWRSLGELNDIPEFRQWLEREFPAGAAEMDNADLSRRNFLKLMGAATALAGFGLSGCRRPETTILSYAKHVEWAIPGKPLFYASAMPRLGGAMPLVVTTHDGRPTKLEGNPLHPHSSGATDGLTQASILDLYDPDRAQLFTYRGRESTAERCMTFLDKWKKEQTGKGTAFLIGEETSPTRRRLRERLREKYPDAQWYRYEPISLDSLRQADAAAFGPGVKSQPRLEKAKKILSLDCDFLGLDSAGINPIKGFSDGRRVEKEGGDCNRLYVVESRYTVTGGMADHRLRTPSSRIEDFAVALSRIILEQSEDSLLSDLIDRLGNRSSAQDFDATWINQLALDLIASPGESLVLCGQGQSPAVHLLTLALNAALGNFGETVSLLRVEQEEEFGSIADLVKEANKGELETLFILSENDPVYDAPSDLDLRGALKKIKKSVRLGFWNDATAKAAHWHIPAAHYLESWDDVRDAGGVYSVIQPMIMPLFSGWSVNEFYLRLLHESNGAEEGEGSEAPSFFALAKQEVRQTFNYAYGFADSEKAWNRTLREGHLRHKRYFKAPKSQISRRSLRAKFLRERPKRTLPSSQAFEVVFAPDYSVYDGRYLNNGWLQETPDPITKLTWDNAALISPKTASELGVTENVKKDGTFQFLSISLDGQTLEIPALIAPGHADYSITLPLGYGREKLGRVAEGTGFNVYSLRSSTALYVGTGAKVAVGEGRYPLALTQEHNSMEGRALVREGTLERFSKDPEFARYEHIDSHVPKNTSLYHPPEFDYDKYHQWGMSIDLHTCIGCNACQVACQAENNIPIVGKEQVMMGREMHWIRMDRYFSSVDGEDDSDPQMVTQPVACMQCESAPCETVCPVNATVHDEEGLNVMAYNRCIGTRYCANNCPYKARRFNFFDYNKRPRDEYYRWTPLAEEKEVALTKMQKNPNVSVRMRGVMEKCTYCVQRLQESKIKQKREARGTNQFRIPTDSVKVACQQACPAEAISFGDLGDEKSEVVKQKASPRNYELLAYIGTRPRTTYLARLKNPNPKMPDAYKVGMASKKQYDTGHGEGEGATAH